MHTKRQQRKEERTRNHPMPQENAFADHVRTLAVTGGEMGGRMLGSGVGGAAGHVMGEALAGDGVAGMVVGSSVGAAAGGKFVTMTS